MKGIIDRFEEDVAVIELHNGKMIKLSKKDLPEGISEGDILIIEDGNIIIDKEETELRRKRMKKLIDDLFE